MKLQIKNYLKLGLLLFGVPLFLVNCQKDDSPQIENTFNSSQLSVKDISLETFYNKEIIYNELKKVNAKNNSSEQLINNRIVYDQENEFYINTDEVTLIEKDNFHVLTFYIERENSNTLDNLVLKYNSIKDGYDPYLAEYSLSKEEIDNLKKDESLTDDFLSKVKIYPLANFNTNLLSRAANQIIHPAPDGRCYVNTHSIYNDEGELIGTGIKYVDCPPKEIEESLDEECPECGGGTTPNDNPSPHDYSGIDGVGSGPIGVGGTTTPPNGGVASDDNNDDQEEDQNGSDNSDETECLVMDSSGNCTIILTKPKTNPVNSHIEKLNTLTDNPIIKQKLNELAPKIFSVQENNFKEDGARFNRIATNSYVIRPPSATHPHKTSYTPAYQNNETVSIHIHQQLTYQKINGIIQFNDDESPKYNTNSPLHSDGDILEFLDNIEYIESTDATLTNEVTSLLMSQAGIFALVVDDKTKALAAQAVLSNNDTYEKFEEDFTRIVLDDSSNCGDSCFKRRLKQFVKKVKINGQNLGISIYFSTLTQHPNNTITINGWVKL